MGAHASYRPGPLVTALSVATLCSPALAQEHPAAAPPGFRPPGEQMASFIECPLDATIAVLPTVVRWAGGMEPSTASQHAVAEALAEEGLTPKLVDTPIDLGPPPHASQWELYSSALRTFGAARETWSADGDYGSMMEILLEPGGRVVFGIHTYVLDAEGRNVFSFLLNAHHPVFAAADLFAADETDAARAEMIAAATRVGIGAFKAQVDHARSCLAWDAANPPLPAPAGIVQNFEAGLPSARDPYGILVGFSTFTDGPSRVGIHTSSDHPARADEPEGNHVLRVDLDVMGWAGLAHLMHDVNESPAIWRPQDWSGFDGLSFWMYGRNSGAGLFVDVIENRHPCSTVNDAETWVYHFTDDFSGWKRIVVPFDELVRKEIGNGAPDDGLQLTHVHGWAFGATATGGAKTWYLDEVALWTGGG